MPIISIMIGKQIIFNVLLDGSSGVNVISERERCRLGLPKPIPTPYKLLMADGTMVQPVGILRDVCIHIHGIPYTITLTVIIGQDMNSTYSVLLGRPWLRDAHVIHNWANDHIRPYSLNLDKMHILRPFSPLLQR